MVTAVSGAVGLKPTLAAIDEKKRIALANKETLVCAGSIVMRRAAETGAEIVPVDSEHSAIFQCLMGRGKGELKKILLTGSGGPFRGRPREELEDVTPEQAVKHPNWSMGAKISVDSATMMNKGLEFIEAMHLFGVTPDDIQVVIHPQSVIHSMVELVDGTVIAQLGVPDMGLPIQLALTYPERRESMFDRLDFWKLKELSFEAPDYEKTPCLRLAMDAARVAKRLGAEHVYIAYRRGRDELPARKEEVEHAEAEGIEFQLLNNPTRILAGEDGHVTGIELLRQELGEPDAKGRRSPVPVPGSEWVLDVDTVIIAIGTSPNPLIRNTTEGLTFTRKGGIEADEGGRTAREGVFAGGDAVTGAATVILAMGAGKAGAKSIDEYIKSKK